MAYVLVAVGALMAAAGLYTIGYSVLNARFDEYWTALGAGATLVAGGVVTIALGFAIRALAQLKSVLAVPSVQAPEAAPASREVDASQPALELPAPSVAAEAIETGVMLEAETPTAHAPVEAALPPIMAGPPPLPTSAADAPATVHPLRPEPPVHSTIPERPVFETSGRSPFSPRPLRHEQPLHQTEAKPNNEDLFAGSSALDLPDLSSERHAIEAARPADDYKLESPSTSEHDIPGLAPTPPSPAQTATNPEMPDDWLDRAFAALDEELPVGRPSNNSSASAFAPQRDPQKLASFEPAPPVPGPSVSDPVVSEPIVSEPIGSEPAVSPSPTAEGQHEGAPSPTTPPPSPVIGRYEADGTSYVLYADGSIEAQSSSGVYRFASMEELKSYIEN